jgi:Fe-S oxidoreductase
MLSIEKAVLSHVKKRGADYYAIPPKDNRVAVAGASIAGLACALGLAQKQYQVTVFDTLDGWGGSLRGHPKFEVFDEDFRSQFSAVKVEFIFGAEIDERRSEFETVYEAPDNGDPIYEIVEGAFEAVRIETYLQTNKYPEPQINTPERPADSRSGSEFSEQETQAEASRCLQCDCSACIDACVMLRQFRKEPRRLALEFFTDAHVNPPLNTHSLTREAYSCTDCGMCKAACPKDIDLGILFYEYRKMRAENDTVPTAFHDVFLRRMKKYNAEGRDIPPSGDSKYVFFPGCSVSTEIPAASKRVYAYLREKFGAGLLEHCCGSPEKWAGLDNEQLTVNSEQYTYIYACPSCYETLHETYPELKLISVYELLDDFDKPEIPRSELTIFHACSARENETLQRSVEKLAAASGIEYQGSELSCCGYGGQTQLANPSLFRDTVNERKALNPNPYLVYCANCRDTFKRQGKECYHVLELLFPSDDGELKSPLIIPDDAREYMSDNLISESDILEVINNAEDSGDKFVAPDGSFTASLERGALTYWVEYRVDSGNGNFEIISAYYHRMKFRQEGQR